MSYFYPQRVSVIVVLKIAAVHAAIKHNLVLVSYPEQLFQVERLTHKPVRMVTHDVLDIAALCGLDQGIPPWSFPVPLPCRRAVINKNIARLYGQSELRAVVQRKPLLTVHGDLLFVTLHRLTAVDRRKVGIGDSCHGVGSSAPQSPALGGVWPDHTPMLRTMHGVSHGEEDPEQYREQAEPAQALFLLLPGPGDDRRGPWGFQLCCWGHATESAAILSQVSRVQLSWY